MPIETTYTQARANLSSLLEKAGEDGETIIIRRRNGEAVALISAAELTSLKETAHLLRSPRNAERLLAALKSVLADAPYQLVFQPEFVEDLRFWVETDRATALRVFKLIEAIARDPFSGIGKPEPLKYLMPNTWSRRITQEHRLVYLVRNQQIDFLQARYHY